MREKFKRQGQAGIIIIGAIALFLLGGFLGWSFGATNNQYVAQMGIGGSMGQTISKQEQLRLDMRKLWEDHITWTRMFIVSAAYDNGDTSQVTARLMKNQEDIGNAMKPYFGEEAGNRLTSLLKEHISLAADPRQKRGTVRLKMRLIQNGMLMQAK